jgi:S-formylglutathione hydrolase FrmB
VVYFLHGRGENRFMIESLGLTEKPDQLADSGKQPFIVVAPEGGNGYWMNGAHTREKWADVITQELIADVESKYAVKSGARSRILAGISMGGHGAIQLSLNHPGKYAGVAAHSPVFRTQEEASRDFSQQFGWGDDFQNRDPFSLMMIKGKKLTTPVWIDIGGNDFAEGNTRAFADYLRSIGQPKASLHIGEDGAGAHATGYWSYHLPEYLRWYSGVFEQAR